MGGSGSGTVPGGCGNSPSPVFSFFSFNLNLPPEGIDPCGYSGAVIQSTATTGPVTFSYTPPPVSLGPKAGVGTVNGSLSGGSNFTSLEFPINWGKAWDINAGLLARAYGTADSNFLSTARPSGVSLFDANRQSPAHHRHQPKRCIEHRLPGDADPGTADLGVVVDWFGGQVELGLAGPALAWGLIQPATKGQAALHAKASRPADMMGGVPPAGAAAAAAWGWPP